MPLSPREEGTRRLASAHLCGRWTCAEINTGESAIGPIPESRADDTLYRVQEHPSVRKRTPPRMNSPAFMDVLPAPIFVPESDARHIYENEAGVFLGYEPEEAPRSDGGL